MKQLLINSPKSFKLKYKQIHRQAVVKTACLCIFAEREYLIKKYDVSFCSLVYEIRFHQCDLRIFFRFLQHLLQLLLLP